MTAASGPVVPRLQLAKELRELRAASGARLGEVAAVTLISSSKLSRLENAQGSPQLRDVRDLVNYYGIAGTDRGDKLLRLQRAASRKAWWTEYSFDNSGFAANILDHVAYESEATIARVFAIPFIPALLQEDDYTSALYTSLEPWRSRDDLGQLLALRKARKEFLREREQLPPLQLLAVAHECAVRQLVGTREIMRHQLRSILDNWDSRSNVELRILPFTAPPPFTSTCMYTHWEFGDALDRDIVHIETHAGMRSIETDKWTSQYRRHFDELMRRSLRSDDSKSLIASALASWA